MTVSKERTVLVLCTVASILEAVSDPTQQAGLLVVTLHIRGMYGSR